MHKILVVEDDDAINLLLHDLLIDAGYDVNSAHSGTEALLYLEQKTFDLILLDLMLPGCSGESLIEKIRSHSEVPIVVITAKGGSDTLVEVLKIGADDFIRKPFDVDEVLARIEAKLRKSSTQSISLPGGLFLDQDSYRLFIDEQPIKLTAKEFELMKLFIHHPNKVYSKQNLYESVWHDDYYGDDNTITVHMSRLRAKIKEVSDREIIETLWGIGFKLKNEENR